MLAYKHNSVGRQREIVRSCGRCLSMALSIWEQVAQHVDWALENLPEQWLVTFVNSDLQATTPVTIYCWWWVLLPRPSGTTHCLYGFVISLDHAFNC